MKTITICGSMHFFAEIEALKQTLEEKGYPVCTPMKEGLDIDYAALSKQEQIEIKKEFIDAHIEKIKAADAILVANYSKHGKEAYIGANTFLEMAFAYLLQKKIYILYDIPDQANTVEIEGLMPICLYGNIDSLSI